MNYLVQYNNGKHSCGPIVLANALRHQGHKVGRKHLPWLARKLKSHGDGVYVDDLDRVAREMGAFRRLYKPTQEKINAHLVDGDGVAVRVGMRRKDGKLFGHYMLLSAIWCHRGNVSHYVCNIGKQCKWMEFRDVDRHFRRFYEDWWCSHFWVVPREGKRLRLFS